MNRFYPLAASALVVLIAVLPGVSAAGDELTLFVFVTPPGRGVGETVDINVEAYLWGTPVNVETLDGTVGFFAGTALTFTNVSTGKWHATHTITAADAASSFLSVTVSADLAGLSQFNFASYELEGGGSAAGWEVKARVANYNEVGYSPAPGATVLIEGRSYYHGVVTEGGPLNATVAWSDGMATSAHPNYENLTGTKQAAGVYRFSLAIPSTILVTRTYLVQVALGNTTSSSGMGAAFFVHPFPVMGYVSSSSTTGATVKVWAGGEAPLAGADVKVSGTHLSITTFASTPVTQVTGTVDAKGSATVNVTWSGAGIVTLFANVSSGGKTAVLVLFVADAGGGGGGGWMPTPNIPFGCSAALQTDPTKLKPWDSATLKFRVTDSGTLLVSKSLARFVWREGASGTAQAGNVSTDASGNLTLTYAVPSNWTSSDTLNVHVVCPSGDAGSTTVDFGGASSGPDFTGSKVTVTHGAASVGGTMRVTATYGGTLGLDGAQGIAFLVPGDNTANALFGITGSGPQAPLTRSGATFSGDLRIPSWYPTGSYVLLVIITNEGATNTAAAETTEGNVTVINVGAAGTTGGGGFLGMPGFGALGALAAVAAAGLGAVEVRRRRL